MSWSILLFLVVISCTVEKNSCPCIHKNRLTEATILETKVNRGLPTLKLEGITSYRNGCQTICPHREEAQHHHCQPQLPSPRQKNDQISPARQWGSSLPGLRKHDPPISPPSTPVEICSAHIYRVIFKNLPQTLRSHTQSFRTLGQLLKI